MRKFCRKVFCCLMACLLMPIVAYSSTENVEGLEYTVSLIKKPPFKRYIKKRYDLYEVYFSNNSYVTYSIPGYSLDLGVDLFSLSDISSQMKGRHNRKFLLLNVATTAASVALGGGIIVQAGRLTYSAVRGVAMAASGKSPNRSLEMISTKKTYVLYPGDRKSIFLFVRKSKKKKYRDLYKPKRFRFLCKDEENGKTHVVINSKLFSASNDIGNSLGSNLYNLKPYEPIYAQSTANLEYDYYKPVTIKNTIKMRKGNYQRARFSQSILFANSDDILLY